MKEIFLNLFFFHTLNSESVSKKLENKTTRVGIYYLAFLALFLVQALYFIQSKYYNILSFIARQ